MGDVGHDGQGRDAHLGARQGLLERPVVFWTPEFQTALGGRDCYNPHLTAGEIEAQNGHGNG